MLGSHQKRIKRFARVNSIQSQCKNANRCELVASDANDTNLPNRPEDANEEKFKLLVLHNLS